MMDIIKMVKLELESKSTEASKIDQEVNDIYHYIEFSNFNACQGYLLSKMLKATLTKRRELKEETAELHAYVDALQKKKDEMKKRSKERVEKYKKEVKAKNILG
jgi:hypothetical protein